MALFTQATVRNNTLTTIATDVSCARAREIADGIIRVGGNVSYVADASAARSLANGVGYGDRHTVFFESPPDPATMHNFLWLERHRVGVKAHGVDRVIEHSYADNLPASDVEMIRLNSTKKANGYETRSVRSESEARSHFANTSGEQRIAYDWSSAPAETYTVEHYLWNPVTKTHCLTTVGTSVSVTDASRAASNMGFFALQFSSRFDADRHSKNSGTSYIYIIRN